MIGLICLDRDDTTTQQYLGRLMVDLPSGQLSLPAVGSDRLKSVSVCCLYRLVLSLTLRCALLQPRQGLCDCKLQVATSSRHVITSAVFL